MNRRVLLSSALVILLNLPSAAQQTARKEAKESEIQERGDALLNQARTLLDIRSPKAPPFRLKATFSYIGDALEPVSGIYTEVWISKSQWHREIVIGDQQQIEVATPGKLWLLDKPEHFPERPKEIVQLMEILPGSSLKYDFESIAEHPDSNPSTQCAITKKDSSNNKSAFCFDKKSGVLLQSASPRIRPKNVVEYSCQYGSFRKFGDFWFPREMTCFEDRHKVIEAKVVDLIPETSLDQSLFTLPPGAVETDTCTGVTKPPSPISAPSPDSPHRSDDQSRMVTVWVVVDKKGNPQNIRVAQPGQKDFDEAAVSGIRRWRFKPATCDGEPMSIQIAVEVQFSTYH